MIRVTFSDETNVLNVELPRGWHELTDEQLQTVHSLIVRYADEDVRFHVFRILAGMKVSKPLLGEGYQGSIKVPGIGEKHFRISPITMSVWMSELDWLASPGYVPVRISKLRNVDAVDANLHGCSFDTYLMVENYYQGFIQSKDNAALSAVMRILYPCEHENFDDLMPFEVSNILTWLVQLKNMFAMQFRNLFKASGGGETPNMLEVMNNEIRALTGGDVTKEDEVRNVDCWRALTELDFKAKEAEDFKKQLKTKK